MKRPSSCAVAFWDGNVPTSEPQDRLSTFGNLSRGSFVYIIDYGFGTGYTDAPAVSLRGVHPPFRQAQGALSLTEWATKQSLFYVRQALLRLYFD